MQANVGGGTTQMSSLQYAGFWRRVAAFLIDSIVITVIMMVLGLLAKVIPEPGASIITTVALVGYSAGFESSKLQATPGKLALGIIVTDADGNRINFARALARNLAMALSSLIFGIGYLMVLWTKRKQGLHDMVANCLVLRKPKA